MSGFAQRFLLIYAVILSCVVAVVLLAGAVPARGSRTFDEITVHRINVVEPDGTLRMVISNHASLSGVIVRGKEQKSARPQAGMLFYNDEGSENGGLVFGGHRNAAGEIVDSGGSLSFDKYDDSQIVQLAGVDDKDDRFAGVVVKDSVPAQGNHRRVWVGRGNDGNAVVELMDAKGRKRISMEVPAEGGPRLAFWDVDGKVVNQLTPVKP